MELPIARRATASSARFTARPGELVQPGVNLLELA